MSTSTASRPLRSLSGTQYINLGALCWFVGFLLYFSLPGISVRLGGYLYGVCALVGGILIGIGMATVDWQRFLG